MIRCTSKESERLKPLIELDEAELLLVDVVAVVDVIDVVVLVINFPVLL